uniref:EF-hand domain-containing protein n=1 Tax=Florenciella parvula TaxID=236787 RepID=A0A7S2BIJ1_9STRA|mmetsp:Transcript_17075/g.35693  ORF Transcript_17075/g.35693 Transcript_17075/m.35693 type:complete len:250 (+) Transcript_17075:75-824(+)|eukprot:CAMPEP_0182545400 /NCGR_PEP_ID=MMETSP1323-20130603/34519_1 /TAXON_ID=236787 /ORGANISM="Florenciella parvula, Strain RCC1693" /LENGTH=249 /DNA_ID=CAMNT_0024756551 /DNA_START=73 /DNA_END=822 /DNA_ORIENTATION=+
MPYDRIADSGIIDDESDVAPTQSWLQKQVQMVKNKISLQLLGFIAGALLIFDGVVGIFFGSAFGLDAVHVLLEMVMVFAGFVVLMIEGADKLCTPDDEGVAWCQLYRGKLFHFARFLFVPIGRGYFYLYISVMLLAQYPDPVDLGVFFYMFFFTIFCLNVGYQTQRKLYELKCEFDCTEDLNSALVKTEGFVENEGRMITKVQFEKWAREQLSVIFERNELDAAFLTIDADQDGFISFNEMEEWWGHDI